MYLEFGKICSTSVREFGICGDWRNRDWRKEEVKCWEYTKKVEYRQPSCQWGKWYEWNQWCSLWTGKCFPSLLGNAFLILFFIFYFLSIFNSNHSLLFHYGNIRMIIWQHGHRRVMITWDGLMIGIIFPTDVGVIQGLLVK